MCRGLILLILVSFTAVDSWESAALGAAAADGATRLDTDPHLAGWWKFDEPSGSIARDSSQRGRDATLIGGLSFDQNSVPGRIGTALDFDGRRESVEVTGYKGVAGTAPRTICVWIKTGNSRGDILSWGAEDFGQMWILRFIRGHVGATPKGGYYYMENSVHDQAWHHVAVVVGEAELPNLHDDVTLYLDGEIAKPDRIGLLDLWPIETGAEHDVTVARGFKGAIDELRLYDRALSDEEVKTLYDLGN